MKVRFLPCSGAARHDELVCVVDVISAFTTAAALFAQNAAAVLVVADAERARALKLKDPMYCLVGEAAGKVIDGFDYANDCTQFVDVNFASRVCVLKTSSGTVGLITNAHVRHLIAASLCNAKATAAYIRAVAPASVAFVISNDFKSAEDVACAAYICEMVFGNKAVSVAPYRTIIGQSCYAAHTRENGTTELAEILAADRFDFVMVCRSHEGHLEMRAVRDSRWETPT